MLTNLPVATTEKLKTGVQKTNVHKCLVAILKKNHIFTPTVNYKYR